MKLKIDKNYPHNTIFKVKHSELIIIKKALENYYRDCNIENLRDYNHEVYNKNELKNLCKFKSKINKIYLKIYSKISFIFPF